MLVTKGRLGKMWSLSGRKQETLLLRLSYSVTFFLSLHQQML